MTLASYCLSNILGASDYTCVWNNETLQFDQTFIEARFSVSTFYYIMFGWMCVACVSFYLINSHAKRIESLTFCGFNRPNSRFVLSVFCSNFIEFRSTSNTIISINASTLNVDGVEQNAADTSVILPAESVQSKKPNRFRDVCILTCLALVGFSINTLIPSIQTYAALPYSQVGFFCYLSSDHCV